MQMVKQSIAKIGNQMLTDSGAEVSLIQTDQPLPTLGSQRKGVKQNAADGS